MTNLAFCGISVLIDDEDVNKVLQHKWYPTKSRLTNQNLCYFHTHIYENGRRTTMMLHRFIMNCMKGDGVIVDHINRNTLDCTKNNLRKVDSRINGINQKLGKNNKSGFKGVCYYKQTNRWKATICIGNGMRLHLGYFPTKESAYERYSEASRVFQSIDLMTEEHII